MNRQQDVTIETIAASGELVKIKQFFLAAQNARNKERGSSLDR
jgi:hypothetical protein